MLPKQKIIAFDIDGTLTVSKSLMAKDMADLLKSLIKERIVVAIGGGRYEQLKDQFIIPFNADSSTLPFINNLILLPTSGSQRYEYNKDTNGWECTDSVPLSNEIKDKARKLFQEIIDSGSYYVTLNPKGEIVEDRVTQLTFSALGQNAPIEEKEIWDPDQKKRQKIKAFIEPQIPEATVRIGGTTSIDILSKDFDKMAGLNRLLDAKKLEKIDVLFLGDAIFPGGNDYAVKEGGVESIQVKGPEDTGKIIRGWLS